MSKHISQQVKDEIINYYLSKPMTLSDVKDKFNLSLPTIGKILKNYPKYNKAQIFSPCMQEHWFQNIDTQEKAYYLGLFISDGNICFPQRGGQAINSLTLSVEDEYLLQQWLQLINSNKQVAHDGRGCAQASILSDIMAEDLKQWGIIPNKSFYTYLPQIQDSLMSHLIRGILDGDGSIEAKWHIAQDGCRRFKHNISFCGSHQLMENLKEYFKKLNFNVIREVYDYKNRKLSELKISNYNDIQILGNWLYADANIYMLRKKQKYDLIVERINNMKTLC